MKRKSRATLPAARLIVASVTFLMGTPLLPWGTSIEAYAAEQSIGNVTGTVVDQAGEPLIGASVFVVGRNEGVATDIDGNFSLNNIPMGAKLKVSYVGFQEKEVTVTGSQMTITMSEDTNVLDEVVVVGYGSQKKATMTGAVTAIGSKEFEKKGNLSSPVQALQGQVPGVIITRSSSAPGDEGWGMKLRGAISKNTSEPLLIIDGVEYESVNELRLLNPSDIESMNFLKDAAASIYGSKAAGGVVVITTKKAKETKTHVSYNGSVTLKHVGLVPKQLSLSEWADALITARTNDGYTTEDNWIQYALLAKQYPNQYFDLRHSGRPITSGFGDVSDFTFFDTDWNDVMWGDAVSTSHELAVSGGKEGALFRLSLGYMYDDSNLKWGKNNNNRYNFRLNNDFDLSKALKLSSIVSYNRQDQVAPTQIDKALTASTSQPGLPASSKNGKPYGWGGASGWQTPNWQCELGGENKLAVSAINISETLTAQIIDGLRAVVTLGYNTSTASRDIKSVPIDFYNYEGDMIVHTMPTEAESYYTKSSSRTDFYSAQAYLEWSRRFHDVHDLKLMAGVQYNHKRYDYSVTTAKEITPSLEVINGSGLITLKNANNKNGCDKWKESILSYYGRANYAYRDKYLLEAQVRYDGSSKFQPENRWAAFWGVSLGWRLAQESFMEFSRDWLNEFKIRLSYGNVGNQNGIGRYDGVQLYNFTGASGALIGGQLVSYIDTDGNLVSTDRTWERVHNYNIGLDFGFLNSRLVGTVEWFRKKTNNMLIGVTYPAILGDRAPSANMGAFKAWGWEGQLTWRDRIGNVSYSIGGTFTYADNKLTDNGGPGVLKAGVSDREGYPLNSVFGLRYCGKIQNKEQLDKYIDRYGATSEIGTIGLLRVGDNMYEDVNGDGKLSAEDLVYLGSDDPKIQYSFNAGLEWKGFDIQVIFQGAAKRTVWRMDGNGNADTWRIPMRSWYMNCTNQFVGNVWSESNPDGFYPTLTNQTDINKYNYQCSSWSVEDGSYIRLKNVTVGYTLPRSVMDKIKFLSSVRVYFTGTDLWESSKIHDGWDPEAANKVSAARRYPFLRNYTFGLNINF